MNGISELICKDLIKVHTQVQAPKTNSVRTVNVVKESKLLTANGAREKYAMAIPRRSASQISASSPLEAKE